MAIRNTKFKVSIKELSFEFEGSQEVGLVVQQGIQQSLGSLMQTQARVLAHRETPGVVAEALAPLFDGQHGQTVPPLNGAPPVNGAIPPNTATPVNGERVKLPRQRRPKSGVPMALLREMKAEKFFSQTRSAAEILEKLKLKGHTVQQSVISARLKELTQKNELFRINGAEEGSYVYKDSPFNENPGSPNPSDQSPQ